MRKAVLDTNVIVSAIITDKGVPFQLLQLISYEGIPIVTPAAFAGLLKASR